MKRTTPALIALALIAPLVAQAQSYRCIGSDGKRYYGSSVPPQCYGRPVEELSSQGMVVKRIDPHAAENERRAKAAAEAKKKEEEAAKREASRRNTALLATYTSEKDIDEARARALAENSKAVRDVEARIEAIRKHPDSASAENDLKANLELLEAKKREAEAIKARYDEDKKRYLQITRGK
jgi:hypothetical protein